MKVFSAQSDDLFIGWMVYGLSFEVHIRPPAVQIMQKSSLFGSRTHDQSIRTTCEQVINRWKKRWVIRYSTRSNRIDLVMKMEGLELGIDCRRRHSCNSHRKDFGCQVINPDNRASMSMS